MQEATPTRLRRKDATALWTVLKRSGHYARQHDLDGAGVGAALIPWRTALRLTALWDIDGTVASLAPRDSIDARVRRFWAEEDQTKPDEP